MVNTMLSILGKRVSRLFPDSDGAPLDCETHRRSLAFCFDLSIQPSLHPTSFGPFSSPFEVCCSSRCSRGPSRSSVTEFDLKSIKHYDAIPMKFLGFHLTAECRPRSLVDVSLPHRAAPAGYGRAEDGLWSRRSVTVPNAFVYFDPRGE